MVLILSKQKIFKSLIILSLFFYNPSESFSQIEEQKFPLIHNRNTDRAEFTSEQMREQKIKEGIEKLAKGPVFKKQYNKQYLCDLVEKLAKDPVFNKKYLSDLGDLLDISPTWVQKIQNKLERFYKKIKNNILFWCFLLKNRTIEQKLSAIDHSSSDLLSSEQLERKKIKSILEDSSRAQLIEYLQKLEPCTDPKSPFMFLWRL